jgi:hypothetical protein
VPDAMLQLGVELAADRPLGAEQSHGVEAGQLHRLFLDGHLPQELLRAFYRGARGDRISRRFRFLELLLCMVNSSYLPYTCVERCLCNQHQIASGLAERDAMSARRDPPHPSLARSIGEIDLPLPSSFHAPSIRYSEVATP